MSIAHGVTEAMDAAKVVLEQGGLARIKSEQGDVPVGILNHPAHGMLGQWMMLSDVHCFAMLKSRLWNAHYCKASNNPGLVLPVDGCQGVGDLGYAEAPPMENPIPTLDILFLRSAIYSTMEINDNGRLDMLFMLDRGALEAMEDGAKMPFPSHAEIMTSVLMDWLQSRAPALHASLDHYALTGQG